ncbi:MAG: ABC transporter permease [Oscillibacter sp.]|jgi:putative ABC transport system permease protein|nr:ABC transporter permease [Oscillibacter sp.]
MRKSGFYPRLAMVNLARNGKFYLPYLLTIAGTAAAFYIVVALAGASDLPLMTRYAYLSAFMGFGTFVIALFAVIFLTYTNSFLMKRRKRELGLYNILGLGKRHIALVLGFETLYTAIAGICGGILLGMLLQKLVTMLLYKIMHFGAYYGFYISWKGMLVTAVLFGLILLGNLLLNLFRIHIQNPMEMLRESTAGEREPKTRLVTAIFGTACLLGGYAIAVLTRSATQALGLYFVAVFLVIIGTYCLFSAVSIVVLKRMRKNKDYYYKTNHFIGVSGMLYRMKRNAVGLANICILSTMVLVMISGTLSLYLGSEDTMNRQFPGNTGVGVEYDPTASDPFHAEALCANVETALKQEGFSPEAVYSYHWMGLMAAEEQGGYAVKEGYGGATCQLCFLTEEDYAKLSGSNAADAKKKTELTLRFSDGSDATVSAILLTDKLPAIGGAFASTIEPKWAVVEDDFALNDLYNRQYAALGDNAEPMSWYGFWNVDGTEEQQMELPQQLESDLAFDGAGSWLRLETQSKAEFSTEYYSMNGGFFFLGLFLGLIFVMATVLIIYYKQISEGYEDRERYLIMQKVGMEEKTVRSSINAQILVVFFAPLLVAAIHVVFDFGLMARLLTLFGLYDATVAAWCSIGTFLAFAAVYALVYRATAKTYYKIVRP